MMTQQATQTTSADERKAKQEGLAREPYVLLEVVAGIGIITLNRPRQRNPLSTQMMDAISAAVKTYEEDRAVRVIVLRAMGPVFSAGHDLKEVQILDAPERADALLVRCTEMMEALRMSPLPVIAQVHALASAAGCQLVASCDLVVAASTAAFQTPGVKIGLFCSTPMIPISRVLTPRKTMEMLLTGIPISAEEAERHGLVNRVVPPEQLETATMQLARHISSHSAFTLALGKRAYYQQQPLNMTEAYLVGKQAMITNLAAEDAREGINAFLEKRSPQWRDR